MLNLPILNVRIHPCGVGEQHLTPQAQGHHCALCDRLVQDFTRSTQIDLEQARAASPDGRVCGRFSAAQLMPSMRLRPKLRRFLVALVLVCGLGLTRQEALAQVQDSTQRRAFSNTATLGMVVEQMPIYKDGGYDGLKAFIIKNLHYPTGQTKEGRVFVSFIITKAGFIEEATVLRGLGAPFDEEALRVIGTLESWIPGTQNGLPVDVRFIIPFHFQPSRKRSH